MRTLIRRTVGSALADIGTYEGIREDRNSFSQAITILVALSLLAAASAYLDEENRLSAAVGEFLALWLGWAMQFALLYIFGTKMRREVAEPPTIGQLVSTVTFSYFAGLFLLLALVPVVGTLLGTAAAFWYFIAYVVSVRAAFVFSTLWDAIVLAVVCGIVQVLPQILVLTFFNPFR